jgi:putative FmdB family regulatory protein
MPLYEYYCDKCKDLFEALGSVSASDRPKACPNCGASADRIMPTTFASMSRRRGLKERVPYHHHDTREATPKKAVARVKPKSPEPPSTDKVKRA